LIAELGSASRSTGVDGAVRGRHTVLLNLFEGGELPASFLGTLETMTTRSSGTSAAQGSIEGVPGGFFTMVAAPLGADRPQIRKAGSAHGAVATEARGDKCVGSGIPGVACGVCLHGWAPACLERTASPRIDVT